MAGSRNATDMAAWQRDREARLAEQRRAREQAQRSATQPRRYTNRTSERIVQRMRAREAAGQEQAPAEEEDAGTRLYRAAIESERRREDRARQAAEQYCHTPQVAPHSASLPRQGDVSERLYGLAQKRALKSAIRRQAREVRAATRRGGDIGCEWVCAGGDRWVDAECAQRGGASPLW